MAPTADSVARFLLGCDAADAPHPEQFSPATLRSYRRTAAGPEGIPEASPRRPRGVAEVVMTPSKPKWSRWIGALVIAVALPAVTVSGVEPAFGAGGQRQAAGSGDWTIQDRLPEPLASVTDVACTDTSNCWAVGYTSGGGAGVIVTADGGATWKSQTLPVGLSPPAGITRLQAVSCPAGGSCFAVGTSLEEGVVVATIDGGVKWVRQTLPPG